MDRAKRLQQRIDRLLHEAPEHHARDFFSPYLASESPDPIYQLNRSAESHSGLDAIEAAVDAAEQLMDSESRGRVRHALNVFLTSRDDLASLGLRVPSLAERAGWKLTPR